MREVITTTVTKSDTFLKEEFITTKTVETVTKKNPIMSIMELPINNFVKTLKEIEVEFCFLVSSFKNALTEIPEALDSYGRMLKKLDGNINIHSLDTALSSGSMEENY